MESRSRMFYAMYPEDASKVRHLLRLVSDEEGGPVPYQPIPEIAFGVPSSAPSHAKSESAAGCAGAGAKRPRVVRPLSATAAAAANTGAGTGSSSEPDTAQSTGAGAGARPSQETPLVPQSKQVLARATAGGRISQSRLLALGLRLGCGNGYAKLHATIDTLWRADSIAERE